MPSLRSIQLARLAAGISLLMLGLQVFRFGALGSVPCAPSGIGTWGWLTVALIPPYPWILLRLRPHRATTNTVGMALGVAEWWSGINLLAAAFIIFADLPSQWFGLLTYWDLVGWFAYGAVQCVLLTSAVRAARTMAGGEPAWVLFVGSTRRVALYVFVLLLVFILWPVRLRPSQLALAEPNAIGTLRAVNSGQATYQQAHPDRGYAATPEELRPGFIHPAAMVSTDWYRFHMTAGAPEASGRVTNYQVWATRNPPQGVCRSFFSDESGVVRFTREHRPATAADPQLN